jgi:hypothetical protein
MGGWMSEESTAVWDVSVRQGTVFGNQDAKETRGQENQDQASSEHEMQDKTRCKKKQHSM